MTSPNWSYFICLILLFSIVTALKIYTDYDADTDHKDSGCKGAPAYFSFTVFCLHALFSATTTTTTLKHEHTCMLIFEGGGFLPSPTFTTLKHEHVHLFSRVVVVYHHHHLPPPSDCSCQCGWWRQRLQLLTWQWWPGNNSCSCSCQLDRQRHTPAHLHHLHPPTEMTTHHST